MSNPYLGQDNPYLTGMIDKAQGDVVRNYNLSTQPAYNSAMVRSGSFGNAGVQEMNQNAQSQLQQNLGNISNQMRGQDYQNQQQMYQWDQQFDRSLYNDAYGQNRQDYMDAMGLLGGQQQATQNDISNAGNIQNTPMQYWQQFSNGANSIGQGYGNSSVQGSGSPILGAIGGAQLGQAAMNSYKQGGWGGGYGVNSAGSGGSDANYADYGSASGSTGGWT